MQGGNSRGDRVANNRRNGDPEDQVDVDDIQL